MAELHERTVPGFTEEERERKRAEVCEILNHGRVPYGMWPAPYNLDSLISFCLTGEMDVEKQNGHALLHVYTSVVTIRHITGRSVSELYEAYVALNGIKKSRNFDGSVSEKIMRHCGEAPLDAARWGIREELGQTEPKFRNIRLDLDEGKVVTMKLAESDYYSGIGAVYHRHLSQYRLPLDVFHDKYIARDHGREHCFLWKTMLVA